ncbi:MAG: phosphatase PAP2 family protein [Bacteroidota bacterium]
MHFKRKALFISFFALVSCFVLLAVLVIRYPVPAIDQKISVFVQQYHSNFLDKIMLGISFFGELPYSLLLVVIVAFLFYRFQYKREAYFIGAILLSGLLILGIKNVVDRPRPTEFYVRLVEINRFQSFPSGHVLSYVLFFGFLIILMRELKDIPRITRKPVIYISAFFILTIAFSRIYLGAHWFSDTLGGLILGLICLLALCYFYFKKKRR